MLGIRRPNSALTHGSIRPNPATECVRHRDVNNGVVVHPNAGQRVRAHDPDRVETDPHAVAKSRDSRLDPRVWEDFVGMDETCLKHKGDGKKSADGLCAFENHQLLPGSLSAISQMDG